MVSGYRIMIVLASLVCLYCISAAVNGQSVYEAVLLWLVPYAVLYFAVMLIWKTGKRWGRLLLFVAICIWSCCESCLGLNQVFGHKVSGHVLFSMTGSFANPGPYGGFIAITAAVASAFVIRHRSSFSLSYISKSVSQSVGFLRNRHSVFYLKWLVFRAMPLAVSAVTSAIGLLVLPASMSRAGWLAYAVALLACLFRETDMLKVAGRRKPVMAVAVLAVLAISSGVFLIKKDSAIGRVHIWNMEMRAVAAAPLAGTGPGTALGAYGRAQEAYFRSGDRPETAVRVAGCPEYAFNEYLKSGMETGIAGLVLSFALAVMAVANMLRSRNIFGYGMLAAAVFAFFSYPLAVVQTAVLVTAFLGVSDRQGTKGLGKESMLPVLSLMAVLALLFMSLDRYKEVRQAEKTWYTARQWTSFDMYEDAVPEFAGIYESLADNYRFLFDYGYALHKTGKYEKSNAVLSSGAMMSSDPMFHNIMGKNYEALGQISLAEKEYLTAHYMVPCRLYPLVLLMKMYMEQGMDEKALAVRDEILSMPVNPKNGTMKDLREEVESMPLNL